MQVTVDIPDEFVASLVPEGTDAARKLLEDTVASAYRERRMTMEQVRQVLGLPTRMHVDPFLQKYEIYDYTAEDLRQDMKVLRELKTQQGALGAAEQSHYDPSRAATSVI